MAAEDSVEVAEVIEADGKAGFRNRAALAEPFEGFLEAHVEQIAVRRSAREFPEDTDEMKRAHANRPRERC